MPKLTRLPLVIACAAAQALAIVSAAAEECGCTRARCESSATCEAATDDSTCVWEQAAALVGKFIAQAACDQSPQEKAAAPASYVIEPPDILSVSFTAAAANCSAKCDNQHCVVACDGRIDLGRFGSVYVAGMTVDEVRQVVEQQLAEDEQFKHATASVDVVATNSKAYYVVTQAAKGSDSVIRLPVTGNETVLDAVAASCEVAPPDDCRMWVARPAPHGVGEEQILPVNWTDIAEGTSNCTNHQLQAGDRLFIRTAHEETTAPPQKLRRVGHRLFAPAAPTPSELATEGSEQSPSETELMVCYDVQIVEDPHGSLKGFDPLCEDGVVVITDQLYAEFLCAMMDRVDVISRPKIMATIGHPASISVGQRAEHQGKDIGDWFKLSIKGERRDAKLAITLEVEKAHAGRRYEAHIENEIDYGHALVARMTSAASDVKSPPTYVIIMPSIPSAENIKLAEPHRCREVPAAIPSTSQK